MITTQPVIGEEAKDYIKSSLEENFTFKQGDDLDSVVSEVLNDAKLHHYLLTFLPKDHGIALGSMEYWDDIHVEEYYGLTIDVDRTPREILVYSYKHIAHSPLPSTPYRALRSFPLHDVQQCNGIIPTPEDFAREVNAALYDMSKNPKTRLKKLPTEKDKLI